MYLILGKTFTVRTEMLLAAVSLSQATDLKFTFRLRLFSELRLQSGFITGGDCKHSEYYRINYLSCTRAALPGVTSSVVLNHLMVLSSGCSGSSCLNGFSSGHTTVSVLIITHSPRRSAAKMQRLVEAERSVGCAGCLESFTNMMWM